MLKGSDYESHVARLANRFLRRQLGVAATIFSSQRNRAALATLLDDAETQGNINADETDELDKTDLILTADGPNDYILAEIFITFSSTTSTAPPSGPRCSPRPPARPSPPSPSAPRRNPASTTATSRSSSYPNPPTTKPRQTPLTDNALTAWLVQILPFLTRDKTRPAGPDPNRNPSPHGENRNDKAQTFPGSLCPGTASTVAATRLRRL